MSRAGELLYARQHECIRHFLEECVDVCGGNARLIQGMVAMAMVSCASQVYNGDANGVAHYLEDLGAELANSVRSGAFELGRNPN